MPDFPRATTEAQLRDWRAGQVGAERLAAAILHLEAFEEIDPQAPLGGPDGRKDFLCRKGSTTYVAAAYFPNSDRAFSDIKEKFEHDLEGAVRHSRNGLIFITNQHIGLDNRRSLDATAATPGKLCILYHRERIRGLLDSPTGYGVRLEFLRIPMNESEQLAYFASSGNRLEYALDRHSREIRNLARRIEALHAGQGFAVQTIYQIAARLGEDVSPPPVEILSTPSDLLQADTHSDPMSAALTPAFLLAVHRLVCSDMPFGIVGKFRDANVWIGTAGSSPADATHVPPAPEAALRQLQSLLDEWNRRFSELTPKGDDEKLDALARFHHALLVLHPFLDGNGRVARAVLIQQCIDLFGHVDPSLLDKGTDHYLALQQADAGNFDPLKGLIREAITSLV